MYKEPKISECKMVYLPKVEDVRGNLTFIEANEHIPFEIKRVYYLYDVPGGESRGGHAHKNLQQFIIAANGSFDVILDDGFNKNIHNMMTYKIGSKTVATKKLLFRYLIVFHRGQHQLSLVAATVRSVNSERSPKTKLKVTRVVATSCCYRHT